jgi:tRNA(fMet)-specific endonuclease VapC
MAWLLDTSVVSDLVREPAGPVADRIREVGELRVATSAIVSAELRFGAIRRGSDRLTRQVEAVLGAMTVLPWDRPADEIYGEIRAHLEARGTPIGANDLLIAAHALALDMVLVTANTREFERVPGLRVVNWRQ